MTGRKAPLAFFLASVVAVSACAHPHVFINNKMTVLFDAGKLSGISFRWVFDDMFSEMILTDFKPNVDGGFSAKQTAAIKSGAFDNLENYHYFLVFFVGKKPLKKIRIEQFTPSVVEGSKLVYSFFVPLDLPVTAEEQSVRVTVYDDTYFVAFDLMHADDVAVKGDDGISVGLSIEKTKVKPLWPGQYMPDNLVIRFKEGS
ncbi:MAG: DUF1007 family protein [Spirochaetia bacterium]|jgi:ABC-type uncharacterized transport system substrate-binding protein